MRDPKRMAEVLSLIGRYWIDHPDLRLGQIIGNMQHMHNIANDLPQNNDTYCFEDSDLISELEKDLNATTYTSKDH